MKKCFVLGLGLFACAGALAAPKGRLVKAFDFEDPTLWREREVGNVFYAEGYNNFSWGRKAIYIRPCQGFKGTGLMFDITGISQGQMQFWTPPWSMTKDKYYKISYMARAVNFDGKLDAFVRGIADWETILPGHSVRPTEKWQEFSFCGKAKRDYDGIVDPKNPQKSFGILFCAADLGVIMVDNIRIEEFDENPAPDAVTKNPVKAVKGNIIPNSSMEIARNKMWSAVIPQNDPALHFTDPGFVRREGGKFGRYCFALEPVVTTEKGGMGAESIDIPVASGVPYTFSFWYKGKGRAYMWCNVSTGKIDGKSYGANRYLGMPKEGWTDEWQRCVIRIEPLPESARKVRIMFSKSGEGEMFIDGLQLEAGTDATDYKPAHPYEIEATVTGGMPNIVQWGEKLPLELSAYVADGTADRAEIPTTLTVTAYPDKVVYKKKVTLVAGETKKLSVEPKVNGIYRIALVPQDPKLAPPFENIAARLPKPRTDVGRESFFGTHISVRPYYIDYAKRIGIKWARLHDCSGITKMGWGNPEPGVYRWHDASIDAMKKAGLHILGMPDYFSSYAKYPKDDPRGAVDNDAFADWCRKAAAHYRGRIDDWEVINEPYHKHFYPGNAKQFAETFRRGADALREGNPDAKILGWCTELRHWGFSADIPKEKIRDLDVSTIHMYFCAAPGGGVMRLDEELRAYREKIIGDKGPKSIWNSEGSWGGGASLFYSFGKSTPRDYIDSAACGARIWLTQMTAGFDKFFFYTTHQTDGWSHRGGYKMLLEYDRTPTVAAVATAVTAWFVDGLDPKPVTCRKGVEEALFSGKGRTTYVVYKDPLETKNVFLDLKKLPENFIVCDVMGTRLNKRKIISLTKTPVFIQAPTENASSVLALCQTLTSSAGF